MKVVLLDLARDKHHHIYKDLAAGFGTKLIIGNSLRARLLEAAKKCYVKLPMTAYGYLNGIFRLAGHQVEYVKNDLKRAAKADIVFTWTSLVDYHNERKALRELKKIGAPNVGVIGPVATLFPEDYENLADFMILGEPESAAIHLANTEKFLTGKIVSPPIKNLDDLPFPSWEGFPVNTYSYFPSLRGTPVLPVVGSRGCFASCEYCAYRTNFQWRMRRPEKVVEELKFLKRQYGIRGVLFRDPMFTAKSSRAEEIARLMIEQKLDLKWACETALEFLNEELLELLFKAGLRSVNVGVESGNDTVLQDVQRRTEEQRRSEHLVAHCNKLGIRVSAFYCLGLPQDTEESIERTIEYAKKLNSHVATFNVFTPYPGTPLYDRVRNEIFNHNWEDYTSFVPVHRHARISPKRLSELREKAFLEFYFRPKYFLSFIRNMLHP